MLVGPIPLEVQNYTIYSGAVSPAARPGRGRALLLALRRSEQAPLLKKKGMDGSLQQLSSRASA